MSHKYPIEVAYSRRILQIILAACSSFFEEMICNCSPEKEPIVVLRDTAYSDLCSILEFMYYGEVRVAQTDLKSLLATADMLRVKGLAEISPDHRSDSLASGTSIVFTTISGSSHEPNNQ